MGKAQLQPQPPPQPEAPKKKIHKPDCGCPECCKKRGQGAPLKRRMPVFLEAELLDDLKDVAEQTGLSQAQIVREALRRELKRRRTGGK